MGRSIAHDNFVIETGIAELQDRFIHPCRIVEKRSLKISLILAFLSLLSIGTIAVNLTIDSEGYK